jgi:hypothetical protein
VRVRLRTKVVSSQVQVGVCMTSCHDDAQAFRPLTRAKSAFFSKVSATP